MKSSARESKFDANALKKVADFFKSLLTKETTSANIKSQSTEKENSINQKGLIL
jgi:hypothetical protein